MENNDVSPEDKNIFDERGYVKKKNLELRKSGKENGNIYKNQY